MPAVGDSKGKMQVSYQAARKALLFVCVKGKEGDRHACEKLLLSYK